MKAAWYEQTGPPEEVLKVGEIADPVPGEGEVRIRIFSSGINPGDVKKREDTFGVGMAFPRIVPHSDGAGVIDAVGPGVEETRIGERVWCFGAQSYRPFGTAAEFCVVPSDQAVELPDGVSFDTGACLGIPGLTARRPGPPNAGVANAEEATAAPMVVSISRRVMVEPASAGRSAPSFVLFIFSFLRGQPQDGSRVVRKVIGLPNIPGQA
jgi:hypothetical protein